MSSETITRTDLTNILNTVMPFSFTEFRNQSGTITVANSTLVQAHSETFTDGSWLILTTLKTLSGGSTTANTGQNRIIKDGTLVYAHKSLADMSTVNTNFYVLKNANNTTISLEAYQATGNSQTQEWTFTAIRIGDKFAEPSADYIVEQGTSGIWTYRKRNSGIAECWGTSAVASNAYAVNGAKNVVASFPFTFATAPVVLVSGYISGNIHTDIGFTQSGTTQAQTYLINRGPAAVTATGGVYWYVIGKWK